MSDQWVEDSLRRGEDEAELRDYRSTVRIEVEIEYEVTRDSDGIQLAADDIKRDVLLALRHGLGREGSRIRIGPWQKIEVTVVDCEWTAEDPRADT